MFLTDIFSHSLFRNEVFKSIVVLAAVGVSTYYAVKWVLGAMDNARDQKIQAQKQAEKLMRQIGIKHVPLTEYELSVAAKLVDPLNVQVTWNDIGGLDNEIAELIRTTILPIHQGKLYLKSSLLQPPKGILLYGPPGCGKKLIAKVTAKEAGCRFIILQPSIIAEKWYREPYTLTDAIFSLAIKIQPTIIFIDEIDSFPRNHSSNYDETTAMIKAQFLSLWDGLNTSHNCQVIVMGATNKLQNVDPAVLQRMPTRIHIHLPYLDERWEILNLILMEYVTEDVDINELAHHTEGFSGSDLREMCCGAFLMSLQEYPGSCSNDGFSEESKKNVTIGQHHLMEAANILKSRRN